MGIMQSRTGRFGVALLIVALVAVSWFKPVDENTEAYVDRSLVVALSSYGVARVVNAGVSVAQSVETGVGVASVEPFQALDPLNDLAEDFASVMKLSIGALIILKLMVEITSGLLFKVLFTAFGGVLLVQMLWKPLGLNAVAKAFLLVGFIRFSLVAIILLVGLVSTAFIDEETRENTEQLASFSELVESYSDQQELTPDERLRLQEQRSELEQRQDRLIEHIEAQAETVEAARIEMEDAQRKLADIKGRLATFDRLNLFVQSNEQRTAQTNAEDKRAQYQDELDALKDIQSSLQATRDDLQTVGRLLAGEPREQGWFSGLSSRLSAISDFVSIERVQQASEQAVTAMLNLMALFVFKTILLPIGFLYVLLKLLNRLWGLDTRAWLRSPPPSKPGPDGGG